MQRIIIGTAGHVDHGKSLLAKSLTGVDPDRLPEEKKREMTIDLGFVFLPINDQEEVAIIDVPGHERFLKTMIAAAHSIRMVLFVVAADEGIMPQTIEHLDVLKLMTIEQGVIVITKIDKVDENGLTQLEQKAPENHNKKPTTSSRNSSFESWPMFQKDHENTGNGPACGVDRDKGIVSPLVCEIGPIAFGNHRDAAEEQDQ